MPSTVSACRTGAVRYLLAGQFRRLVWTEHGDPAAPVLVCVHGLTRNSRDFDVLAQALCDQWRVIAPDLPGRGGSDWLPDAALYQPASYVIALSHLLAHLDRPIDYLGTSLGGICGMAIASMPGQPIRRLVLNDIGPHVPAAALARIRSYISQDLPPFTDLSAAERYLRQVHAPFGRLTDSQWARLARHSVRPGPSGTLLLHYDPLIARQMSDAPPQDIDMWDQWNAIDCPILTMRGEASDLLTEPTLARMTARSATLTIPDAGHAPALMDAPSIDAIRNFLFA